MGQSEVLKLLEKEERWMNVNEIKDKTNNSSKSSIQRTLSKLYQYGEILRKEERRTNWKYYVYKAK